MTLDKKRFDNKGNSPDAHVPKVSTDGNWTSHVHPVGFNFMIPPEWTVQDDSENRATLIFPPGVSLSSQGSKVFCLISIRENVEDPADMREIFNNEFSSTQVLNFAETPYHSKGRKGIIFTYEMNIPQNGMNTISGFQSIVFIINHRAISIQIFGPGEMRKLYDDEMQKIADSLDWN